MKREFHGLVLSYEYDVIKSIKVRDRFRFRNQIVTSFNHFTHNPVSMIIKGPAQIFPAQVACIISRINRANRSAIKGVAADEFAQDGGRRNFILHVRLHEVIEEFDDGARLVIIRAFRLNGAE